MALAHRRPLARRRAFLAPAAPAKTRSTAWLAVLLAVGCRTNDWSLPEEALASLNSAPRGSSLVPSNHRGPGVVVGDSGPARFARALHGEFDEERAMKLVQFIDGFYRAPGNDGYEAVLERLAADLRQAGFGSDARLTLTVLESPLDAPHWGKSGRFPTRAWTPLEAHVELKSSGASSKLHAFEKATDVDRVVLPVHCDSFDVEGRIALDLEQVEAGRVLVTQAAPTRAVLSRAQAKGAVAVLSSYLETYNEDPHGQSRHLDAVQYRQLPANVPLPVLMISPRSFQAIEKARRDDASARIAAGAKVRWNERPLRTLVAVVHGSDRGQEAVAIASHVQEPGACDNASGVAGLAESAIGLAGLLQNKKLDWPSRSVVFLWGDEFRQTSAWLDATDMLPVAGLSSDMTGESSSKTGAIALLERMPDPAALVHLPPDEHTPWGKREVPADSLMPNALAVIARCAMHDVGLLEEAPWATAEHPYEGGSDHDIFIERKLPSALFWHFTDFAYHTSLDRMDMLDAGEMRRTACAILSTALALADPKPTDLDRYLRTLDVERDVRVQAAEQAGDPELKERWLFWCKGAREWARIECLRIPPDQR